MIEFSGKIEQVLAIKSGTSKAGKDWMLQPAVLVTEEQYPHHIAFEIFGEERIKESNIKVGDYVSVAADIDSHEFGGKWYTSIRAFEIKNNVAETVQQPTEQPQPMTVQQAQTYVQQVDVPQADLPF